MHCGHFLGQSPRYALAKVGDPSFQLVPAMDEEHHRAAHDAEEEAAPARSRDTRLDRKGPSKQVLDHLRAPRRIRPRPVHWIPRCPTVAPASPTAGSWA